MGFGSLYTVQEQPVLAFPTVIDLLDIDNPVIGRLANYLSFFCTPVASDIRLICFVNSVPT